MSEIAQKLQQHKNKNITLHSVHSEYTLLGTLLISFTYISLKTVIIYVFTLQWIPLLHVCERGKPTENYHPRLIVLVLYI